MRPLQTYALCALLLPSLLSSCKKDSHSSSPPPYTPTVYVLGVSDDSVIYWNNGKPNPVYSQSGILYNFGTSSLATSGSNVYIAGFEPSNTSILFPLMPVYWINGTAASLPDSTGSPGNGSANSIAVAGGNVYVAGVRGYDSQKQQVPFSTDNAAYPVTGAMATVWKNGEPMTLPGYGTVGLVDNGKYANRFYEDYVTAISVSGTDVYVAGGTLDQSAAHARYWKNGTPIDLAGSLIYTGPNNTSGFPQTTGIFATGKDVYVAGLQQTAGLWPVAIYWKNSTPVFLSTDSLQGSQANSVFVAGSDVYVAGWQNIDNYSRAVLWKNGIATPLTTGNRSSTAYAVTVVGNDVYVAGSTWVTPGNYVASYWKNGTRVDLTTPASSSIAYSISVQ